MQPNGRWATVTATTTTATATATATTATATATATATTSPSLSPSLSLSHPIACRNVSDVLKWVVVAAEECPQDYVYAVPADAQQNYVLQQAARGGTVWINYAHVG